MSEIINYLLTKKEDIRNLKIFPRNIKLNPSNDIILSLIGPRRSGKTYTIYYFIKNNNLRDEDFIFVNFEEIDIKDIDNLIENHYQIYKKYPEYLFFDEIQNLYQWEKQLYKLYEKKRYKIVITGSSSRLLSKEIATSLRGRSVSINVYPFSFSEILGINNLNKEFYSDYEISRIKSILLDYIKRGGLPDIALNNVDPSQYIKDYISLVMYRDIIERYRIKNIYLLDYFIKKMISSHSNKFSVFSLYRDLKSMNISSIKVSKNTLYNYLKIFEDIGFIYLLRRFSRSISKLEKSVPKLYLFDNSIYTYTTYKNDLGILMESVVLQEIIKRGKEINKEIFYFDKNNEYEIDFLIKDKFSDSIKQLIQVSYVNSRDEIDKREIRALIKASNLLNCDNLLIISWDYEDNLKIDNKEIKVIPLWKWLLI